MIEKIIELASKLYSKSYVELFAIELKDYSNKELKEAYETLLADSKVQHIDNASKQWLLNNTTC
jgi:hypothetical protein